MSNLARQGFFQERVVSILKERNRDALESAFRIQRFSNPAPLVELSDGPKKPAVDTEQSGRGIFSIGLLREKKARVWSPHSVLWWTLSGLRLRAAPLAKTATRHESVGGLDASFDEKGVEVTTGPQCA